MRWKGQGSSRQGSIYNMREKDGTCHFITHIVLSAISFFSFFFKKKDAAVSCGFHQWTDFSARSVYVVWVSLLFYNWINVQGPVLQYRAPPDMTDKANPIRMPLNPPSSSPTAWQCHIRHRFERNNRQKCCLHSYFTSITNQFCSDFFRISLIGCHSDTATPVDVKREESSPDDKWRISTQGPPQLSLQR